MNINESSKAVSSFLQSEDIQKYDAGDLVASIIAIAAGNPAEAVGTIKKTITNIMHLPTVIFWDKVERYLRGTFHSYEDQMKMAARFDPATNDYAKFVRRMVSLINQIEDDEKVDSFSGLSRAFFLCEIDSDLFFKLAKYLLLLTVDEIMFIRNCPYDFKSDRTVIVSSLYQFGLFEQDKIEGNVTVYVLSDFAKALKQNCLNFDDALNGARRITGYWDMTPLGIPEAITDMEIDEIFKDTVSYEAKNEALEFAPQA